MANLKGLQTETIAAIDTAKALVDHVLSVFKEIDLNPSLTLSFSANPIGFLIWILKRLGVGKDDLIEWLSKLLTVVTPAMDMAVKGVLLSNLKTMVSCSIDPRIPEKYRKKHKAVTNYNTSQEYGIDIDIESIDFMDKLSVSPLSDDGKYLYFGQENIDNVYRLARAEDFDAFLWFVIHKGKLPNSATVSDSNGVITNINGNKHLGSTQSILPKGSSLLSVCRIAYNENDPSTIIPGNTFKYDKGHVISMCTSSTYKLLKNGKLGIVYNELWPISDDWTSVNWYARKSSLITKLVGTTTQKQRDARDYNQDKAICNLQYINQASSTAPMNGLANNKIRFTILPKPLVHIPDVLKGEPPWRFKKLRFDDTGKPDKDGNFTILNESEVKFNTKDGTYTPTSGGKINPKNLVGCYNGLTVYEFNYDYVMSMKLFDAKVLTASLIESLSNSSVTFGLSPKYIDGKERVKEIIKSIIMQDDSEIKDCYYSFSNTKYDAMLNNAAKRRANSGDYTFKDAMDIIANIDTSNATLHETTTQLKRAITTASVSLSSSYDEGDRYIVEYNFVFNLIENLVQALVLAVLSPKVLMLLEVNQRLMGDLGKKFSFEDILRAMEGVIVKIVKEVRDLIIQELLKLVMQLLKPLIEAMSVSIAIESMEVYTQLIDDIIKNCPFIWFKLKKSFEDTTLDTVDYADIDTTIQASQEEPSTNNC